MIGDPVSRDRVLELFKSDCVPIGPPTDDELERVRFSVIKLALEGPEMFDVAARLYAEDIRDLLVNAELADDPHAHIAWWHSMTRGREVTERSSVAQTPE